MSARWYGVRRVMCPIDDFACREGTRSALRRPEPRGLVVDSKAGQSPRAEVLKRAARCRLKSHDGLAVIELAARERRAEPGAIEADFRHQDLRGIEPRDLIRSSLRMTPVSEKRPVDSSAHASPIFPQLPRPRPDSSRLGVKQRLISDVPGVTTRTTSRLTSPSRAWDPRPVRKRRLAAGMDELGQVSLECGWETPPSKRRLVPVTRRQGQPQQRGRRSASSPNIS